jgi:hypothetical protein
VVSQVIPRSDTAENRAKLAAFVVYTTVFCHIVSVLFIPSHIANDCQFPFVRGKAALQQ